MSAMLHAYLSQQIPAWRLVARGVADLLFPELCPWCDRPLAPDEDRFACRECAPRIERIVPPFCVRCGIPILAGEPPLTCAKCLLNPPAFDRLRAVVVYGDLAAGAIKRFKYKRDLAGGLAMAQALYHAADGGIRWRSYDALIPTPLYPSRYRGRWFNQAALLAAHLPGGHRLPLRADWLERVRDTPPQASLSETARRENVRGAFAVAPHADLKGKRVLLVDDVATTGATLDECARVCRKAGAAVVDAVVVARARV
jgi:ComF family protein